MSLHPYSYPDCSGKCCSTVKRKRAKKCSQKSKSKYGYITSLFPEESQKYVDDIQYSSLKLYKSLKKNVMNKYY